MKLFILLQWLLYINQSNKYSYSCKFRTYIQTYNVFKITRFSHTFQSKNNNSKKDSKKVKSRKESINNELKKINEEFSKFRNEHEQEIEKLKEELNNKNNELEE